MCGLLKLLQRSGGHDGSFLSRTVRGIRLAIVRLRKTDGMPNVDTFVGDNLLGRCIVTK